MHERSLASFMKSNASNIAHYADDDECKGMLSAPTDENNDESKISNVLTSQERIFRRKNRQGRVTLALLGVATVIVLFVTILPEKKMVDSRVQSRSAVMLLDEGFKVLRHDENRPPIRKIALIGERNSGTNWMYNHLWNCFSHALIVDQYLARYKHYFQDDIFEGQRVYDTLAVAMFRHPFYWIKGMQAKPWHAPVHYKRDWKEFLEIPWTMPRAKSDLQLLQDSETKDPSQIQCQEPFNYTELNSCVRRPFSTAEYASMFGRFPSESDLKNGGRRWSSRYPQYELRRDGSGEAYNSVLDMRRDKIYNTLEVARWDWVKELLILRYDELVEKGTEMVVKHIEAVTGIDAMCDPFPPQNRSQRPLEDEYVNYMKEHVDWTAEALLGFTDQIPGEKDSSSN